MLSKQGVDAAVVVLPCTPTMERVVCDFLEGGIPVLVEKPMGWNFDSAKRILECSEKTGTSLVVGYHKRSDPASVLARRTVDLWRKERIAGNPTCVRVFVSHRGDWTRGLYDSAMRGNLKGASVGSGASSTSPFDEMTIRFTGAHSHQMDLASFLLQDSFTIRFAHENGIQLLVESSSGIPVLFEFTPYSSRREWLEYAIVCFERGYVRLDLPAPLATGQAGTVETFLDGDDEPIRTFPVLPSRSAMSLQVGNWLDELDGRRHSLCSAREGFESVRLCEEWARVLSRAGGSHR